MPCLLRVTTLWVRAVLLAGEGVEATTEESPFIEGGTSAEGAEGAAEENEGAAGENEDVNVDS